MENSKGIAESDEDEPPLVGELDISTLQDLAEVVSSLGKLDRVQQAPVISKLGEGGQKVLSELALLSLPDRAKMVISKAEEFKKLVESGAAETACHNFLKANTWLLGLDYSDIRSDASALDGEMDFLLVKPDGTCDILELKGPGDDIIVQLKDEGRLANPPSQYAISTKLSNAIAQAHLYRRKVTRLSDEVKSKNKLKSKIREPRIFIIIGKYEKLDDNEEIAFQEINHSLNRVTILPYDHVADHAMNMAEQILKVMEITRISDDHCEPEEQGEQAAD